jgi:hypothetical protein
MPIAASALEQQLREVSPNAIVFDGFDAAIIGTTTTTNGVVVAYDYEAMLVILQSRGVPADEAREYGEETLLAFDEGPGTPVLVRRLEGTHD